MSPLNFLNDHHTCRVDWTIHKQEFEPCGKLKILVNTFLSILKNSLSAIHTKEPTEHVPHIAEVHERTGQWYPNLGFRVKSYPRGVSLITECCTPVEAEESKIG